VEASAGAIALATAVRWKWKRKKGDVAVFWDGKAAVVLTADSDGEVKVQDGKYVEEFSW
jgi:hypothetical protein